MSVVSIRRSKSAGVEGGVTLGHAGRTVVFVHLWERVAIGVQLRRGLVPPDWEVFLQGAA